MSEQATRRKARTYQCSGCDQTFTWYSDTPQANVLRTISGFLACQGSHTADLRIPHNRSVTLAIEDISLVASMIKEVNDE